MSHLPLHQHQRDGLRDDAGATTLGTMLGAVASLAIGLVGAILSLRIAAKYKAAFEGRPTPPVLPDHIPWATISGGIGVVLVTGIAAALIAHAVGEPRSNRRHRAELQARHDAILADCGDRLISDPTTPVLEDPELLDALEAAQQARAHANLTDYTAAVRTLEARWPKPA